MSLERLLTTELLIVAATFGVVFVLALLLLRLGNRSSTRLQARLSRHAMLVSHSAPQRIGRVAILGRSASGSSLASRALDHFAVAQRWEAALLRANLHLSPARYLAIRIGVAGFALGIVFPLTRSLVFGVVAALLGFLLPRIIVSKQGARRSAAFEGLLAETLDLLVGSLRAGQGLLQAVESTSYEQPEPMRSELRRVVSQVNMGVSISDAMEALTTRFDSRDVDLLSAAIAINRETGGNLTEVLERLAQTVRQRRLIRAEAKSLTAAPRATSYILAILPFAITAYTVAISPIYREQLLQAPLGRLLLIGAIVWSLIGFFISQKLSRAEY